MTKQKSTPVKKTSAQISNTHAVRRILAAYLLVILVLQLFSFEDFPKLISLFDHNSTLQTASAITLVVLELMALPFLIGLKTSKMVLRVSVISVVLALTLLTVFEVFAFMSVQTMLFGATIGLPSGTWSLFFLAAVWVLTLWGFWDLLAPQANKKQS